MTNNAFTDFPAPNKTNAFSDFPAGKPDETSSEGKSAAKNSLKSEPSTLEKYFRGLPIVEKYVPDILKSGASGVAETTAKIATLPFDVGAKTGGYLANRVVDLTEGVPPEHVVARTGKDVARKMLETVMTPVELGAQGTGYVAKKLGKPVDFQSPTDALVSALGLKSEGPSIREGALPDIGQKIIDKLGLDYTPETTPGEITKFAASVAPFPAADMIKTNVVTKKLADTVADIRNAARFESPHIVNENTKAAEAIVKNLKSAQEATGTTPQEVVKMVKEARAAGKPLSLADVGGDLNQRLAGVVYRKGDAGRAIIDKALKDRDAAAAARLTASTNKYLGSGSIRQTIRDLAATRSAEGGPVFTEAMKGGSLAPLEKQYENEFNAATQRVDASSKDVSQLLSEVNKLKEKTLTGYDTEAPQKLRAAQFKLGQKEVELKQAHDDKEMVLEHLRSSQTDRLTGVPGVVWNPRIQRLIDNPRIQAGMAKGYQIERDLADADGRTFDPKEYAITGEQDGQPIASKVPNMRLLAAAKTGLDSMLANNPALMRDFKTGKRPAEGMAVEKLRNSLVKELDTVNPKYKEARDVWAGPSGSIDAANLGESAFLRHPEENAEAVKAMTASEKEFARLGLAEKIREKILKTGFSGDEAKAIIKNPWMRDQIAPFFNSEKEMNAFIKDVTDERTMFESGVAIAKNSLTADRQAADVMADQKLIVRGVRAAVDGIRGAWWNSLHSLITIRSELGLRNNPQLNEAIAKMMFDPKADMTHIEKLIPESFKPIEPVPPAAEQ